MKHEFFDEWMRQKANAHEAPVPADAWEKIAGKKKKRRRILAWWWIPLAAGIVVLGYGTYRYVGAHQNDQRMATAHIRNGIGEKANQNNTLDNGKKNQEDQAIKGQENQQQEWQTAPVKDKDNKTPGAVPSPDVAVMGNKRFNKPSTIPPSTQAVIKENKQTKTEGDTQVKTGDANAVTGISSAEQKSEASAEVGEATVRKELSFDSVYLQPENAVPAVAKAKRQHKYFVELYAAPFLPFQQATQNKVSRVQETPLMKQEFVSSRIHSKPEMGWNGGINVGKQLTARWQVMTGIQYSTFSEKIAMEGREMITHYNIVQRMVNQPGGPVLVNDTVESYENGTRQIEALNRYQTWSIPVMAGYRLMNTRLMTWQLQGGAVVHIARKYQNNISGEFNTDDADKRGSSTVAQGVDFYAGMRFMLHPRSRLRVFAEPAIRYSLLPTQTSDMLGRKRLHQLGLSVGVRYGF